MAVKLNNNLNRDKIKAVNIDGSYAANLGAAQQISAATRFQSVPVATPDISYQANLAKLKAANAQTDLMVRNAASPAGVSYAPATGKTTSTIQQQPAATEAPTTEPPPVASTGNDNAGATTPPLTYDSYPEYLLKLKDDPNATTEDLRAALLAYNTLYAEHVGNTEREAAEAQRAEAERQAEIARQRGIVDANSSYAKNLASYGVNAERLADMGLAGSGYGEYLSAQAYAQQRGDVQQANAQAEQTRNAASYNEYLAKLAADEKEAGIKQSAMSSYVNETADYRDKKAAEEKAAAEKAETERKEAFNGLLAYAKQGGYTAEEIAKLGKDYNLSDDELAMITAAVNEYTTKKYETNKSKLLAQISNGETNKQLIDAALKTGDISKEQHAELIAAYQNKNYNDYISDVKNGLTDTATLDKAYKNGEITEQQYNNIKSEWNKSALAEWNTLVDSGQMDFAAATQAYNNAINSGWCDSTTKSKLEHSYLTTYASDLANKYYSGKSVGGMVDITSSSYSASQWGDFNGIDKSGDWQNTYAQKIVEDAKAGKIAVGKVVTMNVGNVWSDYGCYVYLGDGVFAKVDCSSWSNPKDTYGNNLYIPDGYKIGGANKSIQRK